MLIFNCTKTASELFTRTQNKKKITPIQPTPNEPISYIGSKTDVFHSPWLLHTVKVNRKNVIFAIEANTRYCMTFVGLKKGDVDGFTSMFIERLMRNMQWAGEDISILDEGDTDKMSAAFLKHHSKSHFCTRGDRSLQNHINDIKWQFEQLVFEIGVLPNNQQEASSFDEMINSQLRKSPQFKDYFNPDEEMLIQWLENYLDAPASLTNKVRSRITALRKEFINNYMDI